MAARATIPSGDRAFFELIARVAFCNPFSEERAALDAEVLGHAADVFSESHPVKIIRAMSMHIGKLETNNLADVRKFRTGDRELMQTVFLFECFHQFCDELDRLIAEQLRLGAESAPVTFGPDLLAFMRRRGIGAEESLRFFAIFYQLRRAFHFIVRGLVGKSVCMRELRRHLWQNVFTQEVRLYDRYLWNRMEDFSTLLLGETGTGKGAAAAAIGRSGFIPFDEKRGRFAESFTRSFVALNLSQFPETLIESELFGHRKGSFTGAVEAHEGVLVRCSPHGAIFLDEIGDVSVPIQIKLLQVLQERTFCPVGSHEPVRFRGRVIAATNQPLESLLGRKLFREDFFYRLSSDMIEVPPLRKRLEEDPGEFNQLVSHILAHIVGEKDEKLQRTIEDGILQAVGSNYPWPGNVRELAQAVRRVMLTGSYAGGMGTRQPDNDDLLIAGIQNQSLNAEQLVAGYCALLYSKSRNYEDVARKTNLDRRTVKKYVLSQIKSSVRPVVTPTN
jgi:DNA-binding NtrC family response regulator